MSSKHNQFLVDVLVSLIPLRYKALLLILIFLDAVDGSSTGHIAAQPLAYVPFWVLTAKIACKSQCRRRFVIICL